MRTVFTNAQCAHVWAQLSQPHGRSESMSFDGAVAYSYRTAVAHILRMAGDERVALFTSATYSQTTSSKHMPEYRSAVRGTAESFTVPDLLTGRSYVRDFDKPSDHARNLAYFRAAYDKERDAMMRCPAESWRISDRDSTAISDWPLEMRTRAHTSLHDQFAEVVRYCNVFGIPAPDYEWKADGDAAIARRERLLNDPKRAAKRAAGAAQRERAAERKRLAAIEDGEQRAIESAERLDAWLHGEHVNLYSGDVPHSRGDLLRLRGREIQTSRGATVPVLSGLALLDFWARSVRDGLTYEYGTGEPITVGAFTLNKIYSDGDMRVGCHVFKRAELERFAAIVGPEGSATRAEHVAFATRNASYNL